jgi:hypothetical protein
MNLSDRLRDSASVPIGTDEQLCPVCNKLLSFRCGRAYCRYCEAVNIPAMVRAMDPGQKRRKRWKKR